MTDTARAFAETGRVWLRGALGPSDCAAMRACIAGGNGRLPVDHPLMRADAAWLAPIRAHWPGVRAVRGVMFDKTADDNWAVPWHQDRVIAVRARAEVPGFDAWTRKGDHWHCAPPQAVLSRMLFVRVHLDAATAESGAMEIAPGSHRCGLVRTDDAAQVAARYPCEVTVAAAGDILVLHMLTLHRSPPSQSASRRSTLRFDLADFALPGGLDWAV